MLLHKDSKGSSIARLFQGSNSIHDGPYSKYDISSRDQPVGTIRLGPLKSIPNNSNFSVFDIKLPAQVPALDESVRYFAHWLQRDHDLPSSLFGDPVNPSTE